jgi:hypothetical protein
MHDPQQPRSSNLGLAIVVWITAFAAGWIFFAAATGAQGLGLVWGVFLALAAFEVARRSFRTGIVILFVSLFAILIQGVYSLFR